MPRATGARKNLLLTLWLLLPFAVLALIIAVIFASYGNKAMDARPVGPGAADTGGANALGELLAGNDPDERARRNRAVREGRLINPLDWPGGVYVMLSGSTTAVGDVVLISWTGDPLEKPRWHMHTGFVDPVPPERARPVSAEHSHAGGDLPRDRIAAIAASPHPGAGFYASPVRDPQIAQSRLVDPAGVPLPSVEFPLVARAGLPTDEPIRFAISVDFSATPRVMVRLAERTSP